MRENNNIPVSNHNNAIDEEEEINQELGMQNDYNYFGDTRNRKVMKETKSISLNSKKEILKMKKWMI